MPSAETSFLSLQLKRGMSVTGPLLMACELAAPALDLGRLPNSVPLPR